MNFNATLIGQSITFIVFVWFCMKFIWPPVMHALEERKKKIADGLAAAEHGKHEQELAEERAKEILREAKDDAREEGARLLTAARAEIDQEVNRAREALRGKVVSIALAGAGKVLEREVDESAHGELLTKLAAEI